MTQKIVFDACFDSGAFPGPLVSGKAVVGESWVGPHGLLNILETALGLAGTVVSQAERAAGLIPVLKGQSGFWAESYIIDPFGTAEALLRRRDALCLQGWRGEGNGRLAELARVTVGVQPGYPDRLAAVAMALADCEPGIDEITRLLPVDDLPALWRLVFEGLRKCGVKICDKGVQESSAAGNLGAARKAGFTPDPCDDSLQLLRTAGPLEAAERIAAYLAGLNDLSGTVVIGADSVLDAALRRYNLPTTGARLASGGNALLEILPLVLACGWAPPDPMRVLELLSLPVSPVPRGVAYKLANALHSWPAVGSEAWIQAVADGLAAIEADDRRERITARLEKIFTPAAKQGELYGVEALHSRLGMLIQWLQGRRQLPDEKRPDLWEAAIAQCSSFKRLVECSGISEFPGPLIGRLLEKANLEVSATYVYPAEAGLIHVQEPGCIAGPVDLAIWWGFTKNSASPPERPFLSSSEVASLKAKGVIIPVPARLELAASERRRRPLLRVRKHLVMVCPRRDYDGTDLAPHPLWDEIIGHLKDGNHANGLEVSELSVKTGLKKVPRTQRDIPVAIREWNVKTVIPPRKSESASGAGSLLGCPLAWALRYPCGIYSGSTASLPDGAMLWGSLVHHVIEQVVALKPANAKAAMTAAGEVFDREAPQLAAALFLPGGDINRITVRAAAVKSVEQLWTLVLSGKTKALFSEKEYEGTGLGTALKSRVDLVVDSPLRVVDFKWGSSAKHRKWLKDGSSYQLALYSHLVAGGDKPACPSAYFILQEQTLMSTDAKAFPGADVVAGPSMQESWDALGKSYEARQVQLKAGRVTAEGVPAVTGDDNGAGVGGVHIDPPCDYCEYDGICGLVGGVT
jgi:ATP-dependent helicase/nuclease subunit B